MASSRPEDPETGPETDARTAAVDAAAQLLREAWEAVPQTRGGADLETLLTPAGAGKSVGAAALVPEAALGVAVVASEGELLFAGPNFAAVFPDPEARTDLRELVGRVRKGGSTLGLLEAGDGAAVAAWAVTGEQALVWARFDDARRALTRPGAVLVVAFAPTRSDELARAAIAAFGLTPMEARLAEAFLSASTLEIAAEQIGVGRATARDAMARIMAKTRSRRATDVVRRLTELMSAVRDSAPLGAEVLSDTFGLTRSETEVALKLIAGATQKEAAEAMGLKAETVRGYAKSVLAKAGASRVKDLARVALEAQALSRLRDVAEPVFVSGGPPARLRLWPIDGERNVALLDYGPQSRPPAVIFHGFLAGRSLPPALARGLQARGLRPIVVQRPGFGLTSAAQGDYLAQAAEDLATVTRAMGLRDITLFARDGGTAAALAFAAANPKALARATLLNPRSPHGLGAGQRSGPVARLTRLLLAQPQVIAGLGEFIRRRTRSDHLERMLRETLRALPQDLAALDDPAVLAQLVRDIQAQFAHSCAGYVAEHALYAQGWTPPAVGGEASWTVVHSGALTRQPPPRAPWLALPGVAFAELTGAGVLAQFTHAEDLADLIAGPA